MQDLIDINGDGLPDIVRRDGGKVHVRYNLGNRFGVGDYKLTGDGYTIDEFEDQEASVGLDNSSDALTQETTVTRNKTSTTGIVAAGGGPDHW